MALSTGRTTSNDGQEFLGVGSDLRACSHWVYWNSVLRSSGVSMKDERHACQELAQDVRHFLMLKGNHEVNIFGDCRECYQTWPCDVEELRKSMEKYDSFMEDK